MNDPKKSSRATSKEAGNMYELFLKNLYESGLLHSKKENEGLITRALNEQGKPPIDYEPKMLRMRYLVEDYEEFERYIKESA